MVLIDNINQKRSKSGSPTKDIILKMNKAVFL